MYLVLLDDLVILSMQPDMDNGDCELDGESMAGDSFFTSTGIKLLG
jgi:hypothetical protein